MNVSDLTEFLAGYTGDITLMVRAHGEWHPVDAATLTAGLNGGLAVQLEAADAASASPRGGDTG